MFMLTLTLPAILTPADLHPVTLFSSITVASLGFRRNTSLSRNQQWKHNYLPCHMELATFVGSLKALLTFTSMLQSPCMPIILVQSS